MALENFKLKADQPFIPLNKLLQILQIAQTGGHAKILIQNEEVKVNSVVETSVRKKLYKSDIVEIENHSIKIL